MSRVYSHLTEEERQIIQLEDEKNEDEKKTILRTIASLLDTVSMVSREIKRNTWFLSNQNELYRPYRHVGLKVGSWTEIYYVAGHAQKKAEHRVRNLRRPLRLSYDLLAAFVCEGFVRLESPPNQ